MNPPLNQPRPGLRPQAGYGLPAARPGANPAHTCPRCGGLLKFPDTIGACTNCGYSRSEDVASRLPPAVAPGSPRSETADLFAHLLQLPGWFWGLVLGTAALAGLAFLADYRLAEDSRTRTWISTVAFIAGVGALALAQAWVMFVVAVDDPSVGIRDAISPLRIWPVAVRWLPRTGGSLCVGAWSVTAILCSLLVVGGLSYWMPQAKPGKKGIGFTGVKPEDLVGITNLGADGEPEPDDPPEPPKPAKEKGPDTRPTRECIVIGYQPAADGSVASLVLAVQQDGELKYAGVVERGWTPEAAGKIPARLARLVQTKPALAEVPVEAVWLKPTTRCLVRQSGQSPTGLLVEPTFEAFLKGPAKAVKKPDTAPDAAPARP